MLTPDRTPAADTSPDAPLPGTLSLILPAHNEEANLEGVVRRSVAVLEGCLRDWEIVIVDDGARDRTPEIADGLAAEDARIRAVHHPRNLGYGSAWRSGFAAARGDYIMCMDSDGQFDLADIARLLPHVRGNDVVAGYRIERADPPHRKLNAALFHLVVGLLFRVGLRDLDCGFKIFRADVIRSLPLQSPGALINLEIFSLGKKHGLSVVEVGVNHYPRQAGEPTGAAPRVVLQAMLELLGLRLRVLAYRGGGASVLGLLALAAGLALLAAVVAREVRRGRPR